ncbi:spore germination protein [Metabacillus arenae]|uniref:Spore germination protein n=1 Tax=Metabacillus arenae TaxID=2771434 RepID=A0A926RZU2_9BACI|nr:spore germination protein [Metabacillus arenae]MBD1383506.1 spore germination protein [Metabacillus arenae]
MRRFRKSINIKSAKQKVIKEIETNLLPSDIKAGILSTDIAVNEMILRDIFNDCSDIIFRSVQNHEKTKLLLVYVDGLINSQVLDQAVLQPILFQGPPKGLGEVHHFGQMLEDQLVAVAQTKTISKVEDAVKSVVSANVVILVDGECHALVADMKSWVSRGVEEPSTEPVIRGPKEGFTETLRTNTSMLRRKMKSPRLKIESLQIGEITQTDVALAYIEGIVNESVLNEVRKRVQRIQIDSVLESGYIEEFIEDAPFSPFPTVQYTERPDVVASTLVEGKVAILTDGTPSVLIVPYTFFTGLQAAEDYYERFMYSTAIRWVRFLLFNVALFLPSLYVAITTFHSEMLPTSLLLSFAAAREPSPFPTVIEAILMEVVFEALREAGVRLPKTVGSAVSIVGALVIGESAVRAGIISAPIVIVVAGTGIASFAIPRYNLGIAYRLLRFPLLILAGTFGLFGIVMGFLAILFHLVSLRSFGIPYLSPLAPLNVEEIKDILWRAPRWLLTFRPNSMMRKQDPVRIPKGQKPSPKS